MKWVLFSNAVKACLRQLFMEVHKENSSMLSSSSSSADCVFGFNSFTLMWYKKVWSVTHADIVWTFMSLNGSACVYFYWHFALFLSQSTMWWLFINSSPPSASLPAVLLFPSGKYPPLPPQVSLIPSNLSEHHHLPQPRIIALLHGPADWAAGFMLMLHLFSINYWQNIFYWIHTLIAALHSTSTFHLWTLHASERQRCPSKNLFFFSLCSEMLQKWQICIKVHLKHVVKSSEKAAQERNWMYFAIKRCKKKKDPQCLFIRGFYSSVVYMSLSS